MKYTEKDYEECFDWWTYTVFFDIEMNIIVHKKISPLFATNQCYEHHKTFGGGDYCLEIHTCHGEKKYVIAEKTKTNIPLKKKVKKVRKR